MKKNPSSNRSKQNHQEKNSSRVMKVFYIFMLLLLVASNLIRLTGGRRHTTQTAPTPASESSPAGGVGTVARAFVFYRGGNASGECDDLTVTATGQGVYSNCGKDGEKEYSLSNAERATIKTWIEQFQPVNYEHTDQTRSGKVTTQLTLNGQGSQQASDADIQAMIRLAETLVEKVATQPQTTT